MIRRVLINLAKQSERRYSFSCELKYFNNQKNKKQLYLYQHNSTINYSSSLASETLNEELLPNSYLEDIDWRESD